MIGAALYFIVVVSSIILWQQVIKGQIGAVAQIRKERARVFVEDLI